MEKKPIPTALELEIPVSAMGVHSRKNPAMGLQEALGQGIWTIWDAKSTYK
ncbi:MAG: hypothetical protein K9L59_00385 [Desulfobacterales bacterium]|nr:hypothetical protein [Desulfobacterales bacterium]